jgi:predicted nucleic acid-binding protein
LIVVLDADVLIGALDGSAAHHGRARRCFEKWQADDTQRFVSLVNLTEVVIAPAGRPTQLSAAREAIAALGVSIHTPNEAIAVDAARLRRDHPISLPDAYALATARHVGGQLVSFDRQVVRAAADAGIVGPDNGAADPPSSAAG